MNDARLHAYAVLDSRSVKHFIGMTFPRYRSVAANATANGQVVAVGAFRSQERLDPIGLALATTAADTLQAELLSVYVRPDQRGQGVAKTIVTRTESELGRRGCRDIATVYMTRLQNTAAWESVLDACAWSPPTLRMLVFRTDWRMLEAPWADQALPPDFRIEQWSELSEKDRQQLKESQDTDAWIPKDLVPFDFEGTGVDGSPPEPLASLVLRRRDEAVGWVMSHRISAETVRHSCGYIRPELQSGMLLLPLYFEAGLRALSEGYQDISWAVPHWHGRMLRFARRRMLAYASEVHETRESHKTLPVQMPPGCAKDPS